MTDHIRNKKEKKVIKKRLVLFFDDFERSKLDRIELMGVINEYSENRGIKVIIIADEEKYQVIKLVKIIPISAMKKMILTIHTSIQLTAILTILILKKNLYLEH